MDWLKATLQYFEGDNLDMCGQGIKVNTTPSCNHKLVSQVPFGAIWIILASGVRTQRWMQGEKEMACGSLAGPALSCTIYFCCEPSHSLYFSCLMTAFSRLEDH